jgi:hypothetical protein
MAAANPYYSLDGEGVSNEFPFGQTGNMHPSLKRANAFCAVFLVVQVMIVLAWRVWVNKPTTASMIFLLLSGMIYSAKMCAEAIHAMVCWTSESFPPSKFKIHWASIAVRMTMYVVTLLVAFEFFGLWVIGPTTASAAFAFHVDIMLYTSVEFCCNLFGMSWMG